MMYRQGTTAPQADMYRPRPCFHPHIIEPPKRRTGNSKSSAQ